MVGEGDDFTVVLDDEESVAVIAEVEEGAFETSDVLGMETYAGFVEDVSHIGERRVDVAGDLDALRLAAGDGAGGAREGEVAKAYVDERLKAFGELALDVDGERMGDGLDEGEGVGDGHIEEVGDAAVVDLAGADTCVEARPATFGTDTHGEHRVDGGGVEPALLGVDDATVHTRDETLVFGRLRPVGRRIFQAYLRRVEEEVELFGRVVFDLLVEVEEAAVGVTNPTPPPFVEGDVVDGVLVVERFVEIDELVDVEFADLAEAGTTRAAARGVVEGEGVAIADEGRANAREEEAEESVDVGIGGDGRAAVGGRLALVDDDGDGHVLDTLDLRAAVFREILLYEGREGLVEFATAFGGDGVEAERALSRAGDACEDGNLMFRDFERDVLEVVLAGVGDIDKVVRHKRESVFY